MKGQAPFWWAGRRCPPSRSLRSRKHPQGVSCILETPQGPPPILTQHFPLLWGTHLRQGGRGAKKEKEECILSCRSELKLETLGGEVTTRPNKLPLLRLPCCKRQVHPDSG